MKNAEKLKNFMRPGKAYRRQELEHVTTAVDRDLKTLLDSGAIKKIARGRYALSARLPVHVVSREEEGADLAFWLAKPPEERLSAVELLREQYYALSGYKSLPRLAHTLQLRSHRP
jgi:hypothetical protein